MWSMSDAEKYDPTNMEIRNMWNIITMHAYDENVDSITIIPNLICPDTPTIIQQRQSHLVASYPGS